MEADRSTGRTEEEAATGFQRANADMNVLPEHPPGAWIAGNVATLPEFRRRGLVDRLMLKIMERRRRGATVTDISAFIGNDPTQRAYEKCKYAAVAKRREPEFESIYRGPAGRTLRRSL